MDMKSRDIELEKQIDAYIRGELGPEEVDQLWVKLLKKPEYISLLETEIQLAHYYRQQDKEDGQKAAHSLWKWMGAAAALVLLIISLILIDTGPAGERPLAMQTIDLETHLASAYVTRSATTVTPPDSMLNAGFSAALEGDAERALSIYGSLAEQYPEAAVRSKAYLNTAILQYNRGQYTDALDSFTRAQSLARGDALLRERARWFSANALIHLGRPAQARDSLQLIAEDGQLFREQARDLLPRLDPQPAPGQ